MLLLNSGAHWMPCFVYYTNEPSLQALILDSVNTSPATKALSCNLARGCAGQLVRRLAPRRDASPSEEPGLREIGMSLPNNQRQHRTVHIQKDVLTYALC